MEPTSTQPPQLRSGSLDRVSDLVLGVARDAEHLVVRYAELTRLDLRRELEDARNAAIAIALSAALVGIAGVLLAFAVCRALTYATGLPLAASFAIGGVVLGGAGLVLLKRRGSRELDIVPASLEEAREDLSCIKESL